MSLGGVRKRSQHHLCQLHLSLHSGQKVGSFWWLPVAFLTNDKEDKEGINQCRQSFLLIELCWGKGMVAYTKPQQWKKEESKRLTGEISYQVY